MSSESDRKIVELKIILELWKQNEFHPLIKEKCDSDPEISEFVGYLFMIKFGCVPHMVPRKFKFDEIYKLMVKYRPFSIMNCPENLLKHEDYVNAVTREFQVLQFVPKQHKSKDLCNIAFKQNPKAIMFFPEEYITEQLINEALDRFTGAIFHMYYIPEKYRTPEIIKLSISKWGANIRDIKESERSNALIDIAIRTYGKALQYYKEEDKTYERCVVAVVNDGFALAHVPLKFRDLNMCKLAVKSKGCMLKFVPVDLQPQLYDIALATETGSRIINMIPEKVTFERAQIALRDENSTCDSFSLLKNIPNKWLDEDFCLEAVSKKGSLIDDLPSHLQNSQFYEKIAELSPCKISLIRREFISDKIVKIVVKHLFNNNPKGPNIVHSIPVDYINHKTFFP